MILAGGVAARHCEQAGLAAIYRRQAPPASEVAVPSPGAWDPVSVRAVRRSLRRAEVSLQPGRHHALGLDAYAQVTSPLRRYQDLANQRQIAAHLAGEAPPYTHEAMQRIAATTEQAEAQARRAERARADFWLLRHLERLAGTSVEAFVVEVAPRPVVQLEETLWEQPMPSLKGAELGERLRVRIERVNPRAALLVLRRE
jgi:exoribonuclease-2